MKRIKFFLILTAILMLASACATTVPKVVIKDEEATYNNLAHDLAELDGSIKTEEIIDINDNSSDDANTNQKDSPEVNPSLENIRTDYQDFKSHIEEQIRRLIVQVDAIEETTINHGQRLDWLDSKIAEANENVDMNAVKGHYIFLPPFENNEYEITEDQKKVLDAFIAKIEAGRFVVGENIDAYGSLTGSDDYNIWISRKRADNTAAYLIKKLGPENAVSWKPAVKWKNYFTATGCGKTEKYGNEKYNRRVRLEKLMQK